MTDNIDDEKLIQLLENSEDYEFIGKTLQDLTKEQLFNLIEHLLKKYYSYTKSIQYILKITFEDSSEYAEIFAESVKISLIDITYLESKIIVEKETALALATRLSRINNDLELASSLILSKLGKDDEPTKRLIVLYLQSQDPRLQKIGLLSIGLMLRKGDNFPYKEDYLAELKSISPKIDSKNVHELITLLQYAYESDKTFLPILRDELFKRNTSGFISFIVVTEFRDDVSIQLLKEVVMELWYKDPYNTRIDFALARIYQEDQEFVVNFLKERICRFHSITLIDPICLNKIKSICIDPLLTLIESELDAENPIFCWGSDIFLADLFDSDHELLKWCEKWQTDPRKSDLILKIVGRLLTRYLNYQDNPNRDRALKIVKYYADQCGVDFETSIKCINLGKDANPKRENKEKALQGLYLLDILLHPEITIDIELLTRNLDKFPYLSNIIGKEWLLRSIEETPIHPLAIIFGTENPNAQKYWEKIFGTLYEHSVTIRKSKLRDSTNAINILSELEVISLLLPHFEVIYEPDIPELRPNKIDLKIKLNDESALLEIATVGEPIEARVAQDAIMYPEGKVKNLLIKKFKDQLKEGSVDLGCPVIIILKMQRFFELYEITNAIYGQMQVSIGINKITHETIESGFSRLNNSFFEISGTNIVSAIGSYQTIFDEKIYIQGRLFRPPPQIVPKYSISKNFWVQLRDALFNGYELSKYQNLTAIEGIDIDIAQKLYREGIEDLTALITINPDLYEIEGITNDRLKEYQREGQRVISIIMTGSIRNLKGMDSDTFHILAGKGVFHIKQLLDIKERIEEIPSSKWDILYQDAQRIGQILFKD